MQRQFYHIEPHPLLKDYIEKLWVFESNGQALQEDIKLIVPNGRIRLAIPYRNGIIATIEDKTHLTKVHSFTLTGMMEIPLNMDIETNAVSGTICAEFSPHGAYSFLHLNFTAVKNKILSLADILGSTAEHWEERIANAETIKRKVSLFQQFLAQQFKQHQQDEIFEYCVQKIISSEGTIRISELERQTGFSSRWLNVKFNERLGISPKGLASVIRFKNYYDIFSSNNPLEKRLNNNAYYDSYYDQSHFLKDFKRFTGSTPTQLNRKMNDWGRLFYHT